MSEKNGEILSAFIDGETSRFEAHLSIKELLRNESERCRWERYHVIGEALRRDLPTAFKKNFCSEVMARIERDTEGVGRQNRYAVLKPIVGLAVAASIAVVAVLGVRSFLGPDSAVVSQPIVQQELSPSSTEVADANSESTTPAWTVSEPRINSYLVNHAEHASRPGMMPRARIVGYDLNRQ